MNIPVYTYICINVHIYMYICAYVYMYIDTYYNCINLSLLVMFLRTFVYEYIFV